MNMTFWILKGVIEILYLVVRILAVLNGIRTLPSPGPVTLGSKREGENGMFIVSLAFPPPAATDVEVQNLSYTINGGEPVVKAYPKEATTSDEFECEDDAVIEGTYQQVDDKQNPGPLKSFSFTVIDDIAPGDPGEVGLNKREV